jgi:hypothetical protein
VFIKIKYYSLPGERLPFRRKISSPYSGPEIKRNNNKITEVVLVASFCWFIAWLTLDGEDGADTVPRNVGLSPNYTAL